jgi:hypothetical protein
MQKFDHNIGFWEKRHFFRRKLSKIAENCDHNIDPRLGEISPIGQMFTEGYFYKMIEVTICNFVTAFFRGKIYINLDQKLFCLHLGEHFHKLIWSPCFQTTIIFLRFACLQGSFQDEKKPKKNLIVNCRQTHCYRSSNKNEPNPSCWYLNGVLIKVANFFLLLDNKTGKIYQMN